MKHNFWMISGGAVSALALIAAAATAAPPPADTVIGNQAAATYESGGETFTVQSNLVETVVNEVYGLDLTNDQTKNGAPGGFVFFPHTITNNGNTDDVFDLTTATAGGTDNFALTNVEVFPDADQDGVPDSLTPIAITPAVLAGETFGVVIRATVPASANPNEVTDFTLTATSQNDATQTQTNTDIVDITTDGIIDVQKDQVLAADADGDGAFSIGDTVSVTLTYSNTGIGDATGVILTDDLPIANDNGDPITLTYSVGSGIWSDAPGTVLTEAAGNVEATNGQGTSLEFEFDGTTLVTAELDTVQAGRSGSVSFDYVITAAPDGQFENIASVTTDTQSPTTSNGSPINVAPTAIFVLADAAATAATPGSGIDGANLNGGDASTTDDDAAQDDNTTDTDDAYLGQSVAFDLVLTNLGNATDTFSIDVTNTDFPVGTIFDIVSSDGTTPLVGDEVLVPAGSATHIQVIARFPTDQAAAVAGPADFDAVITATSQADPALTNTTGVAFDGALLAAPVDLENTDGAGTITGGTGNGAVDDGGDPWNTVTLRPGETATFPLRISVAAGAPANSFDLLASTAGSFASTSLPTGWAVTFYDSAGAQVTNTGALVPTTGAAAVYDYEARVQVPAGEAPVAAPGQNIYFRAESPSNGASDSKLDAVIVSEVVDLQIEADTLVQAAPGGTAVIAHTITNLGNSEVTGGSLTLGATDPFTDEGMTASVYHDTNGDGVFDAGDQLITDISDIPGGIAAGDQARVFIRVQAPSTTALGVVETGDLVIGDQLTTPSGTVSDEDLSNNSVLDTISIVSGDVSVSKLAAVDEDCDGTPESAFSPAAQPADPGACITYQVTADNTGSTDADAVIITDATPAWTTYETCAATACQAVLTIDGAAATPTTPADEAAGTVASGAGFTLAPGSRAVLTFTVQIDE